MRSPPGSLSVRVSDTLCPFPRASSPRQSPLLGCAAPGQGTPPARAAPEPVASRRAGPRGGSELRVRVCPGHGRYLPACLPARGAPRHRALGRSAVRHRPVSSGITHWPHLGFCIAVLELPGCRRFFWVVSTYLNHCCFRNCVGGT